ncbi:hypothetical protein BDV59DRAFT_198348 [Aspergillus ambiguus]|uniref:uncharacterized protein n=1 Tax=Aspergillus ambiguus TaxID=176160 RepID=UPI003CCDBEFF
MFVQRDTDPLTFEFFFMVSLRCLINASPVFRKMLTGPWREAAGFREKGHTTLRIRNWFPPTVSLFLTALHDPSGDIPEHVGLKAIAGIATISDYYDCPEKLGDWPKRCLQGLDENKLKDPKDLMAWLWASYVFQEPDSFKRATCKLCRLCPGPIESMGFPIPLGLMGEDLLSHPLSGR